MTERRVVIVTGAAGSLGRSIVEAVSEAGDIAVGVDIVGDPPVFLADLGTAAGNEAVVRHALEQHGRLDGLVLNAGAQHLAPLDEVSEDSWDSLLDVLLKGPWLAMRAAWSSLTARPGGRIVVVSSVSGFAAEVNKAPYISGKTGVLGLTRAAAMEGAPFGLTANAVAPGWMRTPLVERNVDTYAQQRDWPREQVIEKLLERQAVKRFVETREVADTVAFLLSEKASAITGAVVPVDHGYLAS